MQLRGQPALVDTVLADEGDDRVAPVQGRVLTGLARRIDRDLEAKSIGSPEEIDATMETLGTNS